MVDGRGASPSGKRLSRSRDRSSSVRHTITMSDSADDSEWLASEDISVLRELLQTPEPTTAETLRPGSTWGHDRRDHSNQDDDDSDGETKGEVDEEPATGDGDDHSKAVTALRRQVHLLQQEYDRHLEQNVARSVVKAGGKSAPRAATIKLYRNYERLARVAQALLNENQRLVELLQARQRDQGQWLQSGRTSQMQQPFRAVTTEDSDEETKQTNPQAQWSPMTDRAEAKEPPPHEFDYDNEEMP